MKEHFRRKNKCDEILNELTEMMRAYEKGEKLTVKISKEEWR